MEIPKTIHQIWSEKYCELPNDLAELCETWKAHHPQWQYKLWNDKSINLFLEEYYPNLVDKLYSFKYDMQRWDAIRFLILYQEGGLYADVDYECLENVETLLQGQECSFAIEPKLHFGSTIQKVYFTSALFACVPKATFLKVVIDNIFNKMPEQKENESAFDYCINTTSIGLVSNLYMEYEEKDKIFLIPEELVSPFNKGEVMLIYNGLRSDEFEDRIQKAYAIHYFTGTWVPRLKFKKEKQNFNPENMCLNVYG